MLSKFLNAPKLRRYEEDGRHATWLELFFDLVLVAAIAQVGHLLINVDTLSDALTYVGLFWIIFWVWCGHTVYSTRFDTDDPIFRILTFLNMFALIVMAIEVHNAAHGHGLIFGIAYLSSRMVLIALLARAYIHVKEAKKIIKIYLVGFGTGALVWALSLFFHGPEIYWLWAISLGFEALIPWYIWKSQNEMKNINAEHIPERFGLFTIIVLGENIFAVVMGLENLVWNINATLIAALSFIMAASIWWIYFQHTERAIGQIKLGSGQPYIYSHFPLLLGNVTLGTGTLMLISNNDQEFISGNILIILTAGYALWWGGGVLLHFISCPQEAFSKTSIFRNVVILIILMAIGYMGQGQTALTVMASLCGLSLLYTVWDGVSSNKAKDHLLY